MAFVSETYTPTSGDQGTGGGDGFFISQFRHKKSIASNGVKGLSIDDFELILPLAVHALQTLKHSANDSQYKESLEKEISFNTEKLTKQLSTQKKELEHEVSSLQNLLKDLKNELSASYSDKNKLREQYENRSKDDNSAAEKALQKMRDQFDELKRISDSNLSSLVSDKEKQYQEEIRRIQSTHSNTLQLLQENNDKQYDRMNKLLESEKEEKIKLAASLPTSGNVNASVERGKQGEKEFDELASLYTMGWGELENTSKMARGTDRRCNIRGCQTFFEIKNYTNDVPSKEVDKFCRDLEEHSDSPFGVFISLRSNIVGKKSNNYIQIDWTSKHQMLLYINSFYTHSAEDIFAFIDICVDLANSIYSAARNTPEESDKVGELENKLESIKLYLEKELKRFGEILLKFNRDKNFWAETIRKQYTEYSYEIGQAKQALLSMLDIILGKNISSSESLKNDSNESNSEVTIIEPILKPTPPKTKRTVKPKSISSETV